MSRWDYTGEWIDVTPMVTNDAVDYRAADLPVGSTLSVQYKGDKYTVLVVPPAPINDKGHWRYVYQNERYKTLSAVTTMITADLTLSGNRFFKLRRRRP